MTDIIALIALIAIIAIIAIIPISPYHHPHHHYPHPRLSIAQVTLQHHYHILFNLDQIPLFPFYFPLHFVVFPLLG
jgi:uncharacterized membrane protein